MRVSLPFLIALALALSACPARQAVEPPPEGEAMAPAPLTPNDAAPAPSAADDGARPDVTTEPQQIADDEPLRAGRVAFVGMVRPTKGGLDVRGVTFALEHLLAALPSKDRSQGYDDLLGAKLSVVAELVAEHASSDLGSEAVQSRGGDWFSSRQLSSAAIVQPAVVIEGKVGRSKGFYTLGKHLMTRKDLAWSLRGIDPLDKRVRLWGQPRTYVCHPAAQCLVDGVIPMFDVARAELVE